MTDIDFFTELDSYGLYLRRALQRAGNKKANNLGFLKTRQRIAKIAFDKAKDDGHSDHVCRSHAYQALVKGLDLNYTVNGG